jgi:hypothetical protein
VKSVIPKEREDLILIAGTGNNCIEEYLNMLKIGILYYKRKYS